MPERTPAQKRETCWATVVVLSLWGDNMEEIVKGDQPISEDDKKRFKEYLKAAKDLTEHIPDSCEIIFK